MAKAKKTNITDSVGNDLKVESDGSITLSDGATTHSGKIIMTSTPTTTSSWTTYDSSTTISTHDWLSSPLTFEPAKEKCSKCKKTEIPHTSYNWSDDDKLKRTICKKCHTAIMDKLYGLDNNIKAEEALYGKKDTTKKETP